MITLYTIGFTKKTAEYFFELLRKNNVSMLVDIRVHVNGQLAGFAKSENLGYLTNHILGIPFKQIADFSPPEELMLRWRAGCVCRNDYVKTYTEALVARDILNNYDVCDFDRACFMCTEAEPDYCHRKLLVEYLRDHANDMITIKHLI